MEDKVCAELQAQLEEAQKEIAYYKRLSKEAGNLRLRETEELSRVIAKLKHAEEEIAREREKLKTLSDNAPFGMILIEQEGHFTYINRKFTELFGYNLSNIPDGRTWCRKAYPDAEYRHMVISTWIADLGDIEPGERKPRVFTVTCKDGMQKVVQFISSVLISGDYLITCEDITEMRQLTNQLRQAQKMEAIGTLAGRHCP